MIRTIQTVSHTDRQSEFGAQTEFGALDSKGGRADVSETIPVITSQTAPLHPELNAEPTASLRITRPIRIVSRF
eukprot:1123595-Pyramimonas_sp.AAC.1